MDNSKKNTYLPGFLSSFISRVTSFFYKKQEWKPNYEQQLVNDLKNRILTEEATVKAGGQNEKFKTSAQFPTDSGFPHTTASLQSQQTRNSQFTMSSSYQSQPDQTSVASVTQANMPVFQQTTNRAASSWFNSNDLRRRPLRTNSSFKPVSLPSYPGASQSLTSKFASALGFGGSWTSKPAGLKNEGQNLCFMNSVVQCLSRSPCLVKDLSREMKEDIDCSVAESVLLSSFVELLTVCSDKPGKHKVLNPAAFKEAVSVLNSHLVAPPGERQSQQDAAEFIMWLMDTLMNILNKKCSQDINNDVQNTAKFSVLKFIYGDLTPARINDLKEACRKEISEANGLDNDSYAEPIQRLSDLEWLVYKQKNKSTIDNLFTGQLVEAYHCLSDNHLSVNMQTFNILPVPVVAPRDVSGLVFLEDCFTKFCNIEHLIGKEGLVCSFCNKAQGNKEDSTPVLPGQGLGHRGMRNSRNLSHRQTVMTSTDSAVPSPMGSGSYMSPILGQREIINDSGFHDNVFRTSTPVGEKIAPFPTQFLRDAQRRCLLRQLPECLIIQLLRFTYNQFTQQSRKICAPVSIPLKGLDMTSIVYDKVTNREDLTAATDSYKYDLYGICVHLGSESTSCGHYICYCQESDGTWYKFDDDLVWDVNMQYEITTREVRENAYLLFYKRSSAEQEK